MAIAMANISPDLRSKLERNPESVVRLIVRVDADPAAHVSTLRARGLTVRYVYSLTSTVAVEGPASASLSLAREPWVVSIEEDKPVHTM